MVGFFASRIWKKTPFLRLLMPVIAGILIQDIFSISKWVSVAVILSGMLSLIFSLLTTALTTFRISWLSGILLNILCMATGCQLRACHEDSPLITRKGSRQQLLILEVLTPPARKKQNFACEAALRWSVKGGHCYVEREHILLNFRDSTAFASWKPGALTLVYGRLTPPGAANAGHPAAGSFDYAAWCARKHIHARVFIRAANARLISKQVVPALHSVLAAAQLRLRDICRRFVPDPRQGGLLEALLLGYTRDLDSGVLHAYSDAGVVHIIAISGLHLALIGELLQLGLARLGSRRVVKLLRLLLLLAAVWGYSLLTGGSPSVLRSAVMFSFIALARYFARPAPVMNGLASSAFLLLCDDPFRLWDAGFQLSYAAVLGLVLFVTPIQGWLKMKNKGLAAIWKAASVSLAAQVLTTPLSVWYFHRFPFYFLLSNLVAVPLSSAILLGGIALLAVSAFPLAAGGLGWLLNAAFRLMNGFVAATNQLPGAAATGLSISVIQVCLGYLMIYCICRFAEKGDKKWIFYLLILLSAFLLDGLNSGLP